MIKYFRFIEITTWCFKNPEKLAAIVTKEGVYTISFKPVNSTIPDSDSAWIGKYFDEQSKEK